VAHDVLAEVNAHHGCLAVTELLPDHNYPRAESYHQRCFANQPDRGYCAMVVAPKVEKLRKTFASKVQPA
jgi:peptide-methionine (S)-S-oxide reductase